MTFSGRYVKRPCYLRQGDVVFTVIQLPAGRALTVRVAADVFLDTLGHPNTVRNYRIGVGKTAERIGEGRSLASVADELLWGPAAVDSWNSAGPGVLSWARLVPRARLPRSCGSGLGEVG